MHVAWTVPLSVPVLGLSLARESGTLFVFDGDGMLTRLNASGQVELRQQALFPPVAALLSDDGRLVALVGRRGEVSLLTLDFTPIWQRSLPRRPTAVALESQGRRIAVADETGGLFVFDRDGAEVWRASAARSLTQLAFVPEVPALIGSAEFGLVCNFDHTGVCTWRDGLVAHVGSLSVSGSGKVIVLACFTEGVCSYALDRPRSARLAASNPARLAVVSYLGDRIVTAGLEQQLRFCGPDGGKLAEMALPAMPLALTLEALAGAAIVALADGTLMRVEME